MLDGGKKEGDEKKKGGRGTFKRQPRSRKIDGLAQGELFGENKKRSRQEIEEMVIDDSRKAKVGKTEGIIDNQQSLELMKVGPADQPC